jgi:asparaginyl-tRNA synthetase
MATSTTDSATEGLSVYIDEQIGSDETGDGSIQKPYHSAAHAIVNHGPSPPLNILTRKTETDEWAPIGISALKKARKGAEGIEKKKQKALEAEAKAAEKAAEKGKVKDLVLEEDASLPAAVRVRLIYLRWVARLTCPTDKDQIP